MPPKTVKWEIECGKWDYAQDLLKEGWEPFAVTVETEWEDGSETQRNYIWLRRQITEPPAPTPDETL